MFGTYCQLALHMAYTLTFVEGDMLVCVIHNNNMWCQFSFNVIDTINYMDVWNESLLGVLIADEICHLIP